MKTRNLLTVILSDEQLAVLPDALRRVALFESSAVRGAFRAVVAAIVRHQTWGGEKTKRGPKPKATP